MLKIRKTAVSIDEEEMVELMGGMMEGMNMGEIMLPQLPKEQREEFAVNLVSTLFDKACTDMSEEEKAGFRTKVVEKVTG